LTFSPRPTGVDRTVAITTSGNVAAGVTDAVSGEGLDSAKLGEAAASRVRSAERLRDAVVKALGRIHALLDPKQREQLAFLIRTGAVQF
jgi:hypothetical protein